LSKAGKAGHSVKRDTYVKARPPLRRDVRFGSKADVTLLNVDVRFTPESGHRSAAWECPLCAKSGHLTLGASA
jgi:hypothetical protein